MSVLEISISVMFVKFPISGGRTCTLVPFIFRVSSAKLRSKERIQQWKNERFHDASALKPTLLQSLRKSIK